LTIIQTENGQIAAEHLSVGYHEKGGSVKAVLSDVSFVLRKGEIVALVGPSGSGKSSLIDTLALVRRPINGEIKIDGQATSALSESKRSAIRRSSLGYVFQSFNLIPHMSAVDNVEIACRVEESDPIDRSQSLLSQFGISRNDWKSLPSQLSVGQRQRVSMARALAGHPQFILADEPTGNLDESNTGVVIETLRAFASSGGTVLLATHSQEVAQTADRTFSLREMSERGERGHAMSLAEQ
jgi:ABC-type lipoprotein export system ATPase subunit